MNVSSTSQKSTSDGEVPDGDQIMHLKDMSIPLTGEVEEPFIPTEYNPPAEKTDTRTDIRIAVLKAFVAAPEDPNVELEVNLEPPTRLPPDSTPRKPRLYKGKYRKSKNKPVKVSEAKVNDDEPFEIGHPREKGPEPPDEICDWLYTDETKAKQLLEQEADKLRGEPSTVRAKVKPRDENYPRKNYGSLLTIRSNH
jgi:hypothetical protein